MSENNYLGKAGLNLLKHTRPLVYTILGATLTAVVVIVATLQSTRGHNQLVLDEIEGIKASQQQENQFLMSRITYGEERQRLVLFLRDEIFANWDTMPKAIFPKGRSFDLASAYDLANDNVTASEMFPQVSAILLSATQLIESSWGIARLSKEGAKGLNQFMPSTARLICNSMGREYNPNIMEDDKLSTEMAAKYLDIVYAEYQNWGAALADYNGGPYSARYYLNKDPRLAAEPKAYVPKVLAAEARLLKKYQTYKVHLPSVGDSTQKKDK